jgi:hypothetical protein
MNETRTHAVSSFSVTVFVAGDMQAARQSLRRECLDEGLCVTLTPTTFIYTAGAEEGVAVGFVNYPRFPKSAEEIEARAMRVAERLMNDLCQSTALVVTPQNTTWLTRRT